MKSKLTLIILLFSIFLISQSTWALYIVSPKEGDIVYAGENLTITVKPDPGENWTAVSFGFDAMTYNPLSDEYKITIQVPKNYYGYYDNLVVVAADSSGNSIQLRGKIFVKLPPNIVLQSISVYPDFIVLYNVPSDENPDDIEKFGTRKISVSGNYSDGVKRKITASEKDTTYTSMNENIVTVSQEGVVAAKSKGETKIIVRNGEYEQYITVIVEPFVRDEEGKIRF
ncbi:bacterial Ig-like domain [bacterium BMS3Abin10]|nr:bacterial Ig-like domain [bacterium BMS3Abin10]